MFLDIAANVTGPALAEVTRHFLIDRPLEIAIARREIDRYKHRLPWPADTCRDDVRRQPAEGHRRALGATSAARCSSSMSRHAASMSARKAEIYRIMRELGRPGLAILMISSELTEVIGMADRVVVMREGRIVGEVSRRRHLRGSHSWHGDAGCTDRTPDVAMKASQASCRAAPAGWRVTRSALLPVIALHRRPDDHRRLGERPLRTARNLWNVYEQSTGLALVSLGQTLVILTGGIDLSVGSMISLFSELISGSIDGDGRWCCPCLPVSSCSGAPWRDQWTCIVLLRVHPLIVTLGTGAALQGLTLLYSSHPPGKVPDGFDEIAYGRLVRCSDRRHRSRSCSSCSRRCFCACAFRTVHLCRRRRRKRRAAHRPATRSRHYIRLCVFGLLLRTDGDLPGRPLQRRPALCRI